MQPVKLAIFDIDGTIFRSSLVIELCHGLVKSGIFPKKTKNEINKEYLAWLNRQGSYEAYINKVVKIYVKHIAGKNAAEVYKIARVVVREQKNRVYRFTRDLIKKLKKQGYILVAISGSPSYIVKDYAREIGFNQFFGTELEVWNGKFTGKVLNLDSAFNKAKIIKNLVHATGKVNLQQSLAVGDTESDVSMFNLVGRPILFNPNAALLKRAKKHKTWQVVVERKDVIFKLEKFKI